MPTAPIRSRALPSRADRSRFANHSSRISAGPRETPPAPGQGETPHRHQQQSGKPDHDDAHPGRRGHRNRVGIVRPNAFHETLFSGSDVLPRDDAPAPGRSPDPARSMVQPNETAALTLEEKAAAIERGTTSELAAQLLRSASAASFHCATLSAIMRVDFIAAWLSWA